MFVYSLKIRKKNRFPKIKPQCQKAGDNLKRHKNLEVVYRSINQNQFLLVSFRSRRKQETQKTEGSWFKVCSCCALVKFIFFRRFVNFHLFLRFLEVLGKMGRICEKWVNSVFFVFSLLSPSILVSTSKRLR